MAKATKGKATPKNPPAKGKPVDVWGITTCNSTRKALKFYEAKKIPHVFKDLKESAPPKTLVRDAYKEVDTPKQLFNRSGRAYREGNYKDKVDDMNKEQIVETMVGDPMLIKRPLVKGPGGVAVGYDEDKLKTVAK